MNTSAFRSESIASAWRNAWTSRRFRVVAIVTAVLTPCVLRGLTGFLNVVEARPGVVLPDPLLGLFEAQDVTWLTFGINYVGVCGGIAILLRHPRHLVLAIQTYVGMAVFRMAAMSLMPLDPPAGAIPLQDPVVQVLATGQLLTRDLFFSGHTATLFLIGLSMPKKGLQIAYFAATTVIGFCVLVQHSHYTIDVLAAPFFTYAAFRIVVLVQRRVLPRLS